MVKISNGRKEYDYANKKFEIFLISKTLKEDFAALCKELKMNKTRLLEEFYKAILLRFREGSLNHSSAYIALNIMRQPIIR